jgi:hypothetical protein
MKVSLAFVAVLALACKRHPLPGETEVGDGGGSRGGAAATGTGGVAGGAAGDGAGGASGGSGGAANGGDGGTESGGRGGNGGSASSGSGGAGTSGSGGAGTSGSGGAANGGRGGAGTGGAGGTANGGSGGACGAGACQPGQPCVTGAQCATGFCADGLCCQTACVGPCVSCSLAGSAGLCRPVAANVLDPHGACVTSAPTTCGTDGRCDGAGACRQWDYRTACAATTCTDGVYYGASNCNGSGSCVPLFMASCAPFKCDAATNRCAATCTDDTDCAIGTCMNRICRAGGEGVPCTTGDECNTRICAQGACCASPCDGPCNSCALPGTSGVCTPVPNPDPSWSCPLRN